MWHKAGLRAAQGLYFETLRSPLELFHAVHGGTLHLSELDVAGPDAQVIPSHLNYTESTILQLL